MTWWAAEPLAKAGIRVRRRSWLADTALSARTITYSKGAGTARALAVVLASGAQESVITAADFAASDYLADDWEAVS